MIIQACMVLHNLAIMKGDFFEAVEIESSDDDDEPNMLTRPVRLAEDGLPTTDMVDEGDVESRDSFAKEFFS
jgi:hypothetical protein